MAVFCLTVGTAKADYEAEKARYYSIPNQYLTPVPWNEPVNPEYLPYDVCGAGSNGDYNFQITSVRVRQNYYWQSKAEVAKNRDTWCGEYCTIDHYHILYLVVEVYYTVQCGNKLFYSGRESFVKETRRSNEAYISEDDGKKIQSEAYDWRDLSAIVTTVEQFNDYFRPKGFTLDLPAIYARWSRQKVAYPPFTHVGEPGSLPRPVLLVHGLNSDFKVWGVKPLVSDWKDPAFQNGQVEHYLNGGLPDMLARSQNLDVSPARINRNGIYFFQAPYQTISGKRVDALPHWARNAQTSQSYALYQKLETVLDDFYGSRGMDWRSRPELDLDLVCHSQGTLVLRAMLRGLQQDAAHFPQGAANPANHIRKVVSVNSPNFGSSLAAPLSYLKKNYPGLHDIIADLESTNPPSHRIASATVDAGFWTRAGGGALAGMNIGLEATMFSPDRLYSILDAATFPVRALGGGVVGALVGPTQDVRMEVNGPYMGPYEITVKHLGQTLMRKTMSGPAGFAQKLRDGRQGGSHLNPEDPWILDLRGGPGGTGYPTRPDGSKVTFLPMFSENNHLLLAEIFSQMAEDANRICAEGDVSEGCFAFGALLSNFALKTAGYSLENINFNDGFWNILTDLQDRWLKHSDAVVEVSSQKFQDEEIGLTSNAPNLAGFFEEPRTYHIHNALTPWRAVAHGPFKFKATHEAVGTVAMDNEGASRQGLDLLCALSSSCSQSLGARGRGALLRTAAQPTEILIPTLDPATATRGKTVAAQGVDLTGNFALSPLYTAPGLQGLALQSVRGDLLLVATYEPGLGSSIWWVDSAGTARQQTLAPPSITAQPRLSREGNQITVSFENFSGKSFSTTIQLALGEQVRVSTLAPPGTENVALMVGRGTPSDPTTQRPPQPPAGHLLEVTPVRVFHREARGQESNTSRPRFAVQNVSKAPIQGFKVAYYFTADPARQPRVVVDYPQIPVTLEHLGGDQWRFVLDASNQVVAPGAYAPGTDGWQIRLHHGDWSEYKHLDDWSADYNLGQIKLNRKIVVYDAQGKRLWGREPGPQSTGSNPLQEGATLQWEDSAPWETNMFKPRVSVHNTGSLALQNYRALLYFRVPPGKTLAQPLQDWYTPESRPRVQNLGNGLWVLDMHFDRHLLYPGQSVTESNVGLHLTDWSAFDKTVLGMALLNAQGQVLFGTLLDSTALPPAPAPGPQDLQVWVRDEASHSASQPQLRLRVVNGGQAPLRGFTLDFPFQTEFARSPVLEAWYIPSCASSLVSTGVDRWVVRLHCTSLHVQPGAQWPDEAGAVFGLHYQDYSFWDRTNDAGLQGVTSQWSRSSSIVLREVSAP